MSSLLALMCSSSLAGAQDKTGAKAEGAKGETEKSRVKVYMYVVGVPPYTQTVLEDLTDYLVAKKVSVKALSEPDGKLRNELAATVKKLGGESLLYCSIDIYSRELAVQSINPEGEKLWEERVSKYMFSQGLVKNLIKDMEKKLDGRLGKPGLPVE